MLQWNRPKIALLGVCVALAALLGQVGPIQWGWW